MAAHAADVGAGAVHRRSHRAAMFLPCLAQQSPWPMPSRSGGAALGPVRLLVPLRVRHSPPTSLGVHGARFSFCFALSFRPSARWRTRGCSGTCWATAAPRRRPCLFTSTLHLSRLVKSTTEVDPLQHPLAFFEHAPETPLDIRTAGAQVQGRGDGRRPHPPCRVLRLPQQPRL